MEGRARPGRGLGATRVRASLLAALVGWCALVALWSAGARAAEPGPKVLRLCGTPAPLTATCTALRLVSPSGEALPSGEASPAGEVTSPPSGFLTPSRLHAAYSVPSESKASAKETVAVIDAFDDPTAEADLRVYDEQFGLAPCTSANGCFRKVNQEGDASPLPPVQGEWAGEISIDVQMVHAICESCRVLLVEANNGELAELAEALDTAVSLGAKVVSNSYASPEEPAFAGFYEELAADSYERPGVVVAASSGDCGYLNVDCPKEQATADFPADVPSVVSVGGTTLREEGGTWTSTVWDESGGGCSQVFAAPAWQRATSGFAATGCGADRSVADVAADGDPSTGVDIYDSTPEGNGEPTGWAAFGGTSVATPIVASEFALAGGAQGATQPAATLYAHAGEASAFYDVVSGANGSCGQASSCQATVGFDGPSGLGSPLGLGAFSRPESPTLLSFSPSSGISGSTVKIDGTDLGAVTGVQFGTLAASFTVSSPTQLEATVPDGAETAKLALSTLEGSVSSKAKFKPTLSITGFTPQHGAAGTVVTISGVGFGADSRVSFDGTPAKLKSAAKRKLKAFVPAGAGTGPIAVSNSAAPLGTVQSAASYAP
jgi:Subtilase family/IPT/TIG domain